jgi:NiFe hydrogenase small subunit HydA
LTSLLNLGILRGVMERRDFIRGALGSVLLFIVEGCADDGSSESPPVVPKAVVWVEAGVCTGCLLSLIGSPSPKIESLLPKLPLKFQETLMPSFGVDAMDALAAANIPTPYLLVVDGAIPSAKKAALLSIGTDTEGNEWTGEALIKQLAANASQILAVGSCATFGGMAAAAPNPTGSVDVGTLVGTDKLIRLPGCPPPGQRIAETLAAILAGKKIPLDSLARPIAFYEHTVHAACPRLEMYLAGAFASVPGDPEKCLLKVGCKGILTKSDCPTRLYSGRSFCIAVNHPCIGCAAPGFPDGRDQFPDEPAPTAPFYSELER